MKYTNNNYNLMAHIFDEFVKVAILRQSVPSRVSSIDFWREIQLWSMKCSQWDFFPHDGPKVFVSVEQRDDREEFIYRPEISNISIYGDMCKYPFI